MSESGLSGELPWLMAIAVAVLLFAGVWLIVSRRRSVRCGDSESRARWASKREFSFERTWLVDRTVFPVLADELGEQTELVDVVRGQADGKEFLAGQIGGESAAGSGACRMLVGVRRERKTGTVYDFRVENSWVFLVTDEVPADRYRQVISAGLSQLAGDVDWKPYTAAAAGLSGEETVIPRP